MHALQVNPLSVPAHTPARYWCSEQFMLVQVGQTVSITMLHGAAWYVEFAVQTEHNLHSVCPVIS